MFEPLKQRDLRLHGIIVLGLCLRSINLSTRSIQYDDAFSIFLSRQPWPAIISGTAADTMPPLYYFLLHIWMQISQEIGWLRLLSIGLSLVGLLFLYQLVKTVAGKEAGLWAAFFAAISPLQIYHAQDLRMYALLAAAELGYCLFFVKIWFGETYRRWDWAGLILCGTIAMYSHNLAIFVLAIPDLVLVINRSWKTLMRLVSAQGAIGLLSLPWLLMLPGQIEKIQQAFWTPQPGLVEIIQAILLMTTNLPLPGIWMFVGAVISIELMLLVCWLAWRNYLRKTLFLSFLFLIPPVLLFIASYIMRPVFVPRGFLASTLAYLGLAAVVMAHAQKKWIKAIVAGGFILTALIGLTNQIGYSYFPRSPFRTAMQTIGQQIEPNERIVHDNKLSYFPSLYYAPSLPQHFIKDEPGSPNDTYALGSQQAIGLVPEPSIEEAAADASGIFFITFQKTIDEYQAAGKLIHPNLAWLHENYFLETQQEFNDLLVYYFKSHP